MQRTLVEHVPLVSRINVTPIIDVALVLVIILLVTAPMISADMAVDLPPAQARTMENEVRLSVTLRKNGQLAIDEQVVPKQQLTELLAGKLGESKSDDTLVIVRADTGVPYQWVRETLKAAKDAGAQRIAIATRQEGKLHQ